MLYFLDAFSGLDRRNNDSVEFFYFIYLIDSRWVFLSELGKMGSREFYECGWDVTSKVI